MLHHTTGLEYTVTEKSFGSENIIFQTADVVWLQVIVCNEMLAGRETDSGMRELPPGASSTHGEEQDVWEKITMLLQFSCHK